MAIGKHLPANDRPADNHGPPPPISTPGRSLKAADRLGHAGWLAGSAVALVVLAILTVMVDMHRSNPLQLAKINTLYRAIGLGDLALTPSGREARRPSPGPMAIEGRYLPLLPKRDPGLIPPLNAEVLLPGGAKAP